MRTRKLRLVSALLALAMMFVLLPTAAFAEDTASTLPALAEDEFDYNGLRYKKLNATDVAVVGPVAMWDGELEIPEEAFDSEHNSYTVTKIADKAFSNDSTGEYIGKYRSCIDRTKRLSVVIPKTITKIGANAFRSCTEYNGFMAELRAGKKTEIGLKNVTFAPGSQLETIADRAFANCYSLAEIEIPNSVVTIGEKAFWSCAEMEKVTFQKESMIQSIGEHAFHWNCFLKKIELPKGLTQISAGMIEECEHLEEIVIPEGVTTIGEKAFNHCTQLKTVKIPNSVTTIEVNAFNECPALTTVIYDGTADQWKDLIHSKNGDVFGTTGNEKFQNPEKLKYRCTVSFDANGHGTAPATQQPYKGDALEAFESPKAAGYTFAGWYDEDGKPFVVTSPVEKDMKLTAKWEKIPDHKLTVSGGTFTVDGTEAEGDSADVQEGAEVKVTFKKDSDAGSNVVFDGWEIEGLENAEQYQDKESFAFTMPKNGVTIAARTKTVEEDSDWDAGTVVTTAVLGTGMAVLAYHIGTEVYAEQVLGAGVAVPRTRGDVALKAWELAGKPAVENAAVAPEEAAQAQQWVLESGLMENQKDGTFHPEKWMSRLAALRVLDKAQKMG
ncbi:MAG: hypothetical protein EGQ64_01835 [Ruminococcaceae bacterium]|nr:hypothetical protein [Oscillospiraceae bacterium]